MQVKHNEGEEKFAPHVCSGRHSRSSELALSRSTPRSDAQGMPIERTAIRKGASGASASGR
jgi:hypothetical protein